MKPQYPVAKEFPYNKIGSFTDRNPFAIVTVFPYNGPPFVLKGGIIDIEKWIKDWGTPCMIRYSYWHHRRSRGGVRFKNLPRELRAYIWDAPSACKREGNKNHRFWLHGGKLNKTLRRLPNRFPDEVKELLR